MFKGLKIWLGLWAVLALMAMYTGMDTTTSVIFSYKKMWGNVLVFTPACTILFVSVIFQWFSLLFKKLLVPGILSAAGYLLTLVVFLPYEPLSCILLGLVLSPVGLFHYAVSVHFFGQIYEH